MAIACPPGMLVVCYEILPSRFSPGSSMLYLPGVRFKATLLLQQAREDLMTTKRAAATETLAPYVPVEVILDRQVRPSSPAIRPPCACRPRMSVRFCGAVVETAAYRDAKYFCVHCACNLWSYWFMIRPGASVQCVFPRSGGGEPHRGVPRAQS